MKLMFYPSTARTSRRGRAFTLLELLVSMSITSVLLTLLVQMLSMTQRTWTRTKSQTESYRAARAAFESISRQLSQATLNSYWDYNDPTNPTFYQRQSELHYVSGPAMVLLPTGGAPKSGQAVFFQAPLGLDHLEPTHQGAGLDQALNAWGYFVEYNSDLPERPSFMGTETDVNPEKKRFRLMEFRLPTEKFNLFKMPTGSGAGARPVLHTANSAADLYSWFRTPLADHSEALAENILAVIIQPVHPGQLTPADSFLYDTRRFQLAGGNVTAQHAATRHQLPPTVRLTLIALDEASWERAKLNDAKVNALVQKVNSTLFVYPDEFDQDMKDLTTYLTEDLKLEHRVFNTTLALRSAKWHSERQLHNPQP